MSTQTNSSLKKIRVGILGFGTVGQGTWKHLQENAHFWPKILGVELIPSRASVRSLDKERPVEISKDQLTTDSASIVDDPNIDLVCELMGGVEEAKGVHLVAQHRFLSRPMVSRHSLRGVACELTPHAI